MKKSTIFIDGSSKVLDLQESLVLTHENPYILLKKATILWNYDNIKDYVNNELTYEGYRTFSMLKKIESYGTVNLQANECDETCSLTSQNIINLKNFRPILGFDQNKTISVNAKTKSGLVNINSGLKFINISCNIIDTHNNIYMDAKSGSLVSLAITTTQSLKGSVQHYSDIEFKIETNKGIINQFRFKIVDQNGKQ